jgi:predicted ATPase/DNA-binding SARP family transcriptional activator
MQDAQARGNLRYALSKIRKALPRSARPGLVLDGPSVALDPAIVDVDVARFERLVADGHPEALAQIAGLYRGDLLAGLALAERAFEEWLTSERERLHELAIQGLGRLLIHQQKAGAAEPAVQTGLRLPALDPLQEPVHRAVMRLYARLGRREAAVRQYQLCVDALKRELSTQPEAETTQLYQEILRSRATRPDRAEVSGPARGDAGPGAVADPPVHRDSGAAGVPPPTNLPAPTSELIGRAAALAQVTELLGVHRLVTLIGAGGIGKTLLGLDAARDLLPGFADGVWVAELAPLSDPGLVPVTVAAALGLTLPAGAESPERVAAALGAKRVLLVLDNCEHVIEAAARMAAALLNANPHVRIMATSREPLRAPGEYVYRVLSLELPAEGAQDREDLLEAAAVKLFVARARAVDLRFSPDARSAVITGAVCRRLDGIPLAIELAAARTATLGLEELAVRLDDRFRLLTGGHRTALPRHQTLRATLDWSYELLSERERVVLQRLAVFAGSFALDAASEVAASVDVSAEDVVDAVAGLVTRSLVSADVAGAVAQYRLLETTRAYALEKVTESGEFDQFARRHAEYYSSLCERTELEWKTSPPANWLAVYRRRVDNVRRALDWAFSPSGDASIGVALTLATVPSWMHLSLMTECRVRVEQAIAHLGPHMRSNRGRDMQLFLAQGIVLLHTHGTGSPEMIAALTKALDLAESQDNSEYRLRAMFGLYVYRLMTGDYRGALATAQTFRAVAATTTDPTDALIGDRLVGVVLHILGDQPGARGHLEPLIGADFSTARRSHIIRYQWDQRVVNDSYYARILWLQGFADQAMRIVDGFVDYARSKDHPPSLVYGLFQAAVPIALYTGELTTASQFVKLMIDLAMKHALARWNAWGQCFEGVLLIKRGGSVAGSRLLRAALEGVPEAAFHHQSNLFLAELAEGLGGSEHLAEGFVMMERALARAKRIEEGWCFAELLRKNGELLLVRDAPTDVANAEECFRQALEWGRRQDALSWELRSSTSLARLYHRQGRTTQARKVLDPVYRRFTEGFKTADPLAAKALLDALR